MNPEDLKRAVLNAGLEIYGQEGQLLRIAERVRVHLMDSGVSVLLGTVPEVRFTVRSQRSDFPSASADELFAKVRNTMADHVRKKGFHEVDAATRNITDPVDEAHILDVWHELTYAKPATDAATAVEHIRWALRQPKCIG